MKKIALSVIVLGLACSSIFAADGATVYKKCVTCHGVKAERVYLNKIPALNALDSEKMVEDMKKYKAGELNQYKMGPVMKAQMKSLTEEDMQAVVDYIKTLK